MSVSALATAVALAAATPTEETAPAPIAALSSETVALLLDPPEPEPASETAKPAPPSDPAQYTAPLELPESLQSTEPDTPVSPSPTAGGPNDIIVTGRRPSPADPLEELNATSFEISQSVDETFVAPVAFAYGEVIPRPVRKGLRNFLHNLGSPVVFLNYMLQLKPGKAAETLGRFAINTTLGVGGVVDVAKRKPFNLPHRRNGFANTLG
jgi:phospholipid-binding lipoprotein MlaA